MTNTALYRAYLLKEQLRAVFAAKGQKGNVLLAGWISWARRSRLGEFVKLARDHPTVPAADLEHAETQEYRTQERRRRIRIYER